MTSLVAIIWLVGCATPPLAVQLEARSEQLAITANGAMEVVALHDQAGRLIVSQRLPNGARLARLDVPGGAEEPLVLSVHGGGGTLTRQVTLPRRDAIQVRLAAPAGTPTRAFGAADSPVLGLIDGAGRWVATQVEPPRACAWRGPERLAPVHAGGRAWIDAPGAWQLVCGDLVVGTLTVRVTERGTIGVQAYLPATPTGERAPATATDVIALPAAWWRAARALLGIGDTSGGPVAWGYEGVLLDNPRDTPLDVVVSVSTKDARGAPSLALRPRLRDGRVDDAVSVIARVPARGQTRVALPVWLDPAALSVDRSLVHRTVLVTELGDDTPLAALTRPLAVQVGSTWVSVGAAFTALGALLGWASIFALGGRLTRQLRTVDLVTIGLFASLSFVVGAAGQLLGLGVATVLGPFAPFITGVIEHAFRVGLLATLVATVPRPGVVGLAIIVGWLAAALALGSFHPAHLLYLGVSVLAHEVGLWCAGLTRTTAWRDEPRVRIWARLVLGFGVPNALGLAASVIVSIVLYRLWFSPLYVAALVLGPGFLYVAIGSWWATSLIRSLRAVAP